MSNQSHENVRSKQGFYVYVRRKQPGETKNNHANGVNVGSLLERVGLSSSSDIAAGASTFVVAYALHKMFAPVRISITLGSTPFIVRYLRRIGILKPPKPQL